MSLGIGDLGVSMIRTYVPGGVAVALTALGDAVGIEIPGLAAEHAAAVSIVVLWAAWYGLFRALEQRWPKWGALLGTPAAPVYDPPQGEHEFRETADPVTGAVVERHSITRYPSRAADQRE